MSANNVERLRAPSPEVFFRDYVVAQRPAIFTNLFEESPLRKVDTLETTQACFAHIPVEIRANYMATYLDPAVAAPCRPQPMNIGEYLEQLRVNPETLRICVEYPTPQALLDLLALTSYSHVQNKEDLYSNLFIAGPRNCAHLHYDGDQRDVLMYQVFGVKRIVVIHPRETQKLDPLEWKHLRRTSGVFLENASESERARFLKYTNGYDTLLGPGETMFIPAMAWHWVEYVSPAMSIAYRLGRNPYNRRLAALFPDPSVDVQALSLLLIDPDEACARHLPWLEELEDAAGGTFEDEAERSQVLRELCFDVRARLSGLEPIYSIREWERRKLLGSQAADTEQSFSGNKSAGRSAPDLMDGSLQ